MKKTLFGSYVVLSSLFISCEKKQTWNCECDVTGSTANSYTTTITNATKSNASDLCYKAGGYQFPAYSYSCRVSSP